MTNLEIVAHEAIVNKIYTKEQIESMVVAMQDLGLHTYGEWRKAGYQVRKGEKARIKTYLWKKTSKKTVNKETGKEEKESKFYLCKTYLFTREQVDKIEEAN